MVWAGVVEKSIAGGGLVRRAQHLVAAALEAVAGAHRSVRERRRLCSDGIGGQREEGNVEGALNAAAPIMGSALIAVDEQDAIAAGEALAVAIGIADYGR